LLSSLPNKVLSMPLLSTVLNAVEEESESKLLVQVLHKVNHKLKEIQLLLLSLSAVLVTTPMKKEWVKYSKNAVKSKISECH